MKNRESEIVNSKTELSLRTVNQVSQLTGVSVRTLHYYDEIGLLKPSSVTEAGYRMYDEDNLERLQTIMLFRELEFPLKDIKRMLDNPEFDRDRALDDQIKLLELKREHLDELIFFAKRLKKRGDNKMSFEAFDKSKIEAYKNLAREAWGDTAAFKEYEEKAAGQTDTEKRKAAEDLMDLFFEFGEIMNGRTDELQGVKPEPGHAAVQAQVKKLQDFITRHYYTCTDEILAGLGSIYTSGGDMTKNIDVAGGKGCAEFVAAAIEIYCKK